MGGLSERADWSGVRIMRLRSSGEYSIIPLDFGRLFGAADMSMNLPIQKGDIFFVPSIHNLVRAQVYLLGEVNHPGAVALSPAQRHGCTDDSRTGRDDRICQSRKGPDSADGTGREQENMLVDVGRILKTGSFEDDVPLQDGDVVIVPEKGLLGL